MGALWVSSGAKATMDLLKEEVAQHRSRMAQGSVSLHDSLLVIVPSAAMQFHLTAVLASQGSVLGLRVLTLANVATEIVAQHGEIPRRGAAMLEVLSRRFAKQEPVLVESLGHLKDGFSAVASSVRDLLDSGFEPIHLDAADELLCSVGSDEAAIAAALGLPTPQARPTSEQGSAEQRAAAVLRIAAQVYESLEVLHVGDRSWIYRRAAELLSHTGTPASRIVVAGFAEATGLIGDLIEGLMRWHDAVVIVDRPADPADVLTADVGNAYTDVLLGRLEMVAKPEVKDTPCPGPHAQHFSAPGLDVEVRTIARQIRDILDGGVPPERIGVVCRDIEPYRQDIWRELRRLGIPFSGLEALGSSGVETRRVGALLDVVHQGADVRVDRWLEACGWLNPRSDEDSREVNRLRRLEMVMALSSAGIGHLRDVHRLVLPSDPTQSVPLLVRDGFAQRSKTATDKGGVQAVRRTLSQPVLRSLKARASGLVAFLAAWPDQAPLKLHVHLFRALLEDQLEWSKNPIAAQAVMDICGNILRVHEGSLRMGSSEFRLLLAHQFRNIGRSRLGGEGGGVQVLSAIEARGVTFSHLFVLGCNRDVFPQPSHEDSLLSDRMRRRLHELIPTLPLRAQRYMGERHLFAWLHSATDNITLSWQRTDENGRTIQPSPLVERMRWQSGGGVHVKDVPPLYSSLHPEGQELAFDAAIRSGLHGDRQRFAQLLPIAMREARPRSYSAAEIQNAAKGRLQVLNVLDPDLSTAEGRAAMSRPDPFSGLVGPVSLPLDPRHNDLYITVLEKTARCPWQAFLSQLLRLEPTPDPIHDLPHIEKWMLGDLVHNVLEEIIRRGLGPDVERRSDLSEAIKLGPVTVYWPNNDELNAIVTKASRDHAQKHGMSLPGIALVMQDMAMPFLAVARDTDWSNPGEGLTVLGVEIEGVVPAVLGGRSIHFKADRADLVDGGLVLTDYKTGKPIATGKRLETRVRKFLQQVRTGQRLQASTYTLADVDGVQHRKGRFLFLNPDHDACAREFSVLDDAPEFIDATAEAYVAVLDGWEQGLFFPRLIDGPRMTQNTACKNCDARQACRQGDSGFRQRWLGRLTDMHQNPTSLSPQQQSLLRLWGLGRTMPTGPSK